MNHNISKMTGWIFLLAILGNVMYSAELIATPMDSALSSCFEVRIRSIDGENLAVD